MTVVNVRGTNGSGKSTIAHRLIAEQGGVPILNDGFIPDKKDDLIIGYQCDQNIRIVGRYNVKCGGADTFGTRMREGVKVKGVDDAQRLVELWAGEGHNVLFEGLLVSNIYGRWLEMSRRLGGMIWAFLDTPLEVCWERVYARNGGKQLKPSNHVERVFNTNANLYPRMQAEGEKVLWLNYEKAYEQTLELLLGKVSVPRLEAPVFSPSSTPASKTTSPQPESIAPLQLF